MPKIDIFNTVTQARARRVVILTVTEDCNLRCRYCYEPNKSPRYMSKETAIDAITHYMKADDGFEAVEFDFFGGEPLLAFDVIQDIVDWFHTQGWNKDHLFFISTNSTLLTDEMKNWFVMNKRCVKVGVSLDGNKTAHDINRSDSYDRVKKNLPFIMEHWPDQPAKMTISAETIPYVADSIIELEEIGIPFSANVVFEDIWGDKEQKSQLLELYAQQLDRLVEYYAVRPGLFPARPVDVKLEFFGQDSAKIQQVRGEDCVRWCGSGHEMVVVEVDGSRSPCHRFSPWITGKPIPDQVNWQTSWGPDQCATCKLLSVCPTCAGYNWQVNGDSGIRTTYHCEAFKLEAMASAKLAALRLLQKTPEDLAQLSQEDLYRMRRQVDALLEFSQSGA
jgi:uncharacterized protein